MKPQPETPMTIHNKAPFESQSESPVASAHLERPIRAGKLDSEQRNEGRIEALRTKAAFAFRLTAIHASRGAAQGASGFGSRTHQDGAKRNKPESGIQTSSR